MVKLQGISTRRTKSQNFRSFDMNVLRKHYGITGVIEKTEKDNNY